jgi:type IV pilus assembly protein PilP
MATWKKAFPLALLVALASACSGPETEFEDDGTGGKPPKEKKEGAAQAAIAPSKGPALAPLAARSFRDSDFVESETNRDPFRSFVPEVKGGPKPVATQRKVLMPNTPINNVRLIAIVTGLAQPRAMIVDEKGVGYVASRGDFVGLAEVVQGGGSENLAVSLNWRVDRIRENEVVLAREDPTGPNRPPLTRVIALHDAEEEQALALPNEG